jgi:glutathione-regulated potassium-efflux system ancillary protein KefG
MAFLPPFVVHGTHRLDSDGIDRAAADYRVVVEALRDDRIDLAAARRAPRLNADLHRVVLPAGGGPSGR